MTETQPPSYESGTQNVLHEIAREVRPKKYELDLRKIKKIKERSGLQFKTKQQTDKIRKMMTELRTAESKLISVNQEIKHIDEELLIACDDNG